MVDLQQEWLSAQYSVLGSVLISPEVAAKVVTGTTEEDYSGECRSVFSVIKALFLAGRPIDPVVVNDQLGGSYTKLLLQLMEITPSAKNVEHYIGLTVKQGKLLRLKTLGASLATMDDLEAASKLIEDANRLMVTRQRVRAVNMSEALASFYTRHDPDHKPEYLDWPIEGLNDRIFAEPGDFIIIGGRPSAGKSALSLQLAFHLAQHKRVGFFSLETSNAKLFDRQMASVARIGMDKIKQNKLDAEDWGRLARKSSEITSRKLEYIDASAMSVADIQSYSNARRYEVIFVDYLQIIPATGKDRVQKVAEISMGLHRMAQSSGITVLAMAQLSRGEKVKGSKPRPPELDNLRESGQIEQDADIVFMLSKRSNDQHDQTRLLRVLKNKEGELGEMVLDFDGKLQTFMRHISLPKPPPARRTPKPEVPRQEQFPLLPDQSTPVPF